MQDWNQSVSLVDQLKERRVASEIFASRMRQLRRDPAHYRSPSERTQDFNEYMSRLSNENRELMSEIEAKLRYADPDISPLRLKAKVFRELLELIRKSNCPKTEIIPTRELFRPIINQSSSKKYRKWSHSGTLLDEKWTCCQSRVDIAGCEYTVVNPDSWCLI